MRHLSPAFKHHYGPTSLFVRVTADVITLACAGAMTQRSLLAESDPIARVAPNEAIITFKRVLDAIPRARTALVHEALDGRLGVFGEVVDGELGPSTFREWLDAFQRGDLAVATRIV